MNSDLMLLDFVLDAFDTESEVYLFKHHHFCKLLVPASIKNAPSFEANWTKYKITPKYFIDNNQLGLAELTFTSNRNSQEQYKYSNSTSLNYAVANVTYNFDPVELELGTTTATGTQNIT